MKMQRLVPNNSACHNAVISLLFVFVVELANTQSCQYVLYTTVPLNVEVNRSKLDRLASKKKEA